MSVFFEIPLENVCIPVPEVGTPLLAMELVDMELRRAICKQVKLPVVWLDEVDELLDRWWNYGRWAQAGGR